MTYYDALGRQTKLTDAENVATVWYYDGLSRMTRQTEDFGGIGRNTDRRYDQAGRMTRITDDLGQSTDYVYDARGRLTKTIYEDHDASSDEVVTLYAFAQQPMKRIDQRGIETKYVYDGMGNLLTKQDAWTNPMIVESYAYDKLGRKTMAVLTNGGSTISDVRQYYDSMGRLTRESQAIKGGAARNVDYAYDVAGNRTRLAYPGASRVVNYTHDAANRISLIKDSANTVARYLYVGPGRMSERKYMKASDGSTEVTTLHALYDGMANITRFFHDRADNSVVVGFQYDHDKMGNPQYKLREHQSNYGDEYTYDKLYRLTRTVYDDPTPATPTASPAAAVTDAFGYDSIGNRLNCYLKSATATSYLHNPVNEYTKESTGGTDKYYGSDAAGNLTRVATAQSADNDGDWRYYYDYENQMTKAEKYVADMWVTQGEYARDALMRRVEKVAGGTTTRFYHDGWRAIEETEGTDTPTVERQYVFGNGIDEALVMFKRDGENYVPYYYLADRLWTVEALVNDSAQIVEAYAYRAYGEPTTKTAHGGDGDWFDGDETTSSTSAIGNTIMFTGRQYDPETGLYYYRTRIYDPVRGRFTSRDGLRYVDGMSLYHAYFVPFGVDPLGERECRRWLEGRPPQEGGMDCKPLAKKEWIKGKCHYRWCTGIRGNEVGWPRTITRWHHIDCCEEAEKCKEEPSAPPTPTPPPPPPPPSPPSPEPAVEVEEEPGYSPTPVNPCEKEWGKVPSTTVEDDCMSCCEYLRRFFRVDLGPVSWYRECMSSCSFGAASLTALTRDLHDRNPFLKPPPSRF